MRTSEHGEDIKHGNMDMKTEIQRHKHGDGVVVMDIKTFTRRRGTWI
jgi:hypothetical protein